MNVRATSISLNIPLLDQFYVVQPVGKILTKRAMKLIVRKFVSCKE